MHNLEMRNKDLIGWKAKKKKKKKWKKTFFLFCVEDYTKIICYCWWKIEAFPRVGNLMVVKYFITAYRERPFQDFCLSKGQIRQLVTVAFYFEEGDNGHSSGGA